MKVKRLLVRIARNARSLGVALVFFAAVFVGHQLLISLLGDRKHISEDVYVEWKPCWLLHSPFGRDEMDCGVLGVPEDHFGTGEGTIELPFVVFRAERRSDDKRPLVLAGGGGPGNALGLDRYFIGDLVSGVRKMTVENGRDFVAIDNRGVGSSRPRLRCFEVGRAYRDLLQKGASEDIEVRAVARAYAECRSKLTRDREIDVSKFNVLQAAHDLDALRGALGLTSINVYGVSYGTRVAMFYAREFPGRTETLVLDSVFPPHLRSYERYPKSDSDAFARLFSRCAEDVECANAFGDDLGARFEHFLENLDGRAIVTRVRDHASDSTLQAKLTPAIILTSMFNAMYDEERYYELPFIVHRMLEGDYVPIRTLVAEQYLASLIDENFDDGAYASYTCHDERPFNDVAYALAEAERHPFQTALNRPYIRSKIAMCEEWAVPAGDQWIALPLQTDIPAILFSGELDPGTPAEWAIEAAGYLPNGFQKTLLNTGHDVLAVSIFAEEAAARFLDAPHRNPFLTDCVDSHLSALRFRLQ